LTSAKLHLTVESVREQIIKQVSILQTQSRLYTTEAALHLNYCLTMGVGNCPLFKIK
jgi:hypothetical protein